LLTCAGHSPGGRGFGPSPLFSRVGPPVPRARGGGGPSFCRGRLARRRDDRLLRRCLLHEIGAACACTASGLPGFIPVGQRWSSQNHIHSRLYSHRSPMGWHVPRNVYTESAYLDLIMQFYTYDFVSSRIVSTHYIIYRLIRILAKAYAWILITPKRFPSGLYSLPESRLSKSCRYSRTQDLASAIGASV
jgi:hypothetical protein